MKITIEGDPKEIADLRALALREDQLIDSKIVDAVIAKVTEAVEKSATYRSTSEFCIGIEGYSTHTTPQKNVMTVDFAIIGTALEPKDYHKQFSTDFKRSAKNSRRQADTRTDNRQPNIG